jgi:hypothetical protein
VLAGHTGDLNNLELRLAALKKAAEDRDPDQIRQQLQQIVPEYGYETAV